MSKTVVLNVKDVLSLVRTANDGALAVSGALAGILAMCDAKIIESESKGARGHAGAHSARVDGKSSVSHSRTPRAVAPGEAPLTAAQRTSLPRVRPSSESSDVLTVRVSEDYRTRLSAKFFEAPGGRVYDYIVLISPDGTEHEIRRQQGEGNKGRARVPSAWFGEAGHIAYLHEEEPGVFRVNISRETAPPRPRATATVDRDDLSGAFGAMPARGARGARDPREVGRIAARAEKREKAKRTPTKAQKEARKAFATQNRVVKCDVCGERAKIGETVLTDEDGRVCGVCIQVVQPVEAPTQPRRSPSRQTQAAKPRGNGKAARPTPREEVAEKLRALTGGQRQSTASVLPPVSQEVSERLAHMKAAKARRDAARSAR